MTRSVQSKYSPKVAKKAFRQTARSLNLTYPQALAAREEALRPVTRDGQLAKFPQLPTSGGRTGGRRNPGRMDGMTWNADSFVCAEQVLGFPSGTTDLSETVDLEEGKLNDDLYDMHVSSQADDLTPQDLRREIQLDTLLETARTEKVKTKGLAKQLEYELLQPNRRIIFLDEDEFYTGSSKNGLGLGGFSSDTPDGSDDFEWEDLYYDDFAVATRNITAKGKKRSYAAALKTNG